MQYQMSQCLKSLIYLTLLINLISVSSPLWAQSPDKRQQLEELAQEAFEAASLGQYKEAIERLEFAYEIHPSPTILFNIAAVEAQRPNRCQAAHAAFKRFLDNCDNCKQRAMGESRLQRIEEQCQVEVTVQTTPPGATIFFDGEPISSAPVTVRRWPGVMEIRAELDGYTPRIRSLTVVEATPQNVLLDLEEIKKKGQLQLFNLKGSTRIIVDGRVMGAEALRGIELPIGPHRVDITTKDGRTVSEYAEIQAKQILRFDVATTIERLAASREERPPRVWPFWASAGAAVVAGGIGTGFLIARASTENEARNTYGGRQADLINRANEEGTVGSIALGVAGGAALTAVTTWLWPTLTGKGKPLF